MDARRSELFREPRSHQRQPQDNSMGIFNYGDLHQTNLHHHSNNGQKTQKKAKRKTKTKIEKRKPNKN